MSDKIHLPGITTISPYGGQKIRSTLCGLLIDHFGLLKVTTECNIATCKSCLKSGGYQKYQKPTTAEGE